MSHRVLFVLSHDHGELFNAMYFAIGSGLDAVFAMPRRLHGVHGGDFPYPAVPYRSADDILALADQVRPDAVLLFSGYLFTVNRIFDIREQRRLQAGLGDRGLPIATTDPSVGVLLAEGDDWVARDNPGREWLLALAPQLGRLLADAVHLYLTPAVETERPHHAFFNAASLPTPDEMIGIRQRVREWDPIDGASERWFFVLSPEDFDVQVGIHGRKFWDLLEARMLETLEAGRQPILLAPRPCVERLKRSTSSLGSLVAFSACNYTLFMRLLYEAEHVFYWNAFSASIVARVLGRGPLSFFDVGHLARTLPPFHAVGLDHFYRGCQLPMRDFEARLDAGEIARLAARQPDELQEPLLQHLSGGEAPAAVIEQIIARSRA